MAAAYAPRMTGSIVLVQAEGSLQLDVPCDALITLPFISSAPLSVLACAEIHRRSPAPPLVMVTSGELVNLLPSIALAQRTAHRAICGYALVDPALGAPALDWPDAPVCVISDDPRIQRAAKLRNWRVSEDVNPSTAVPAFAATVLPIG